MGLFCRRRSFRTRSKLPRGLTLLAFNSIYMFSLSGGLLQSARGCDMIATQSALFERKGACCYRRECAWKEEMLWRKRITNALSWPVITPIWPCRRSSACRHCCLQPSGRCMGFRTRSWERWFWSISAHSWELIWFSASSADTSTFTKPFA